jgi:hypothetical protein
MATGYLWRGIMNEVCGQLLAALFPFPCENVGHSTRGIGNRESGIGIGRQVSYYCRAGWPEEESFVDIIYIYIYKQDDDEHERTRWEWG